MWITHVGGEFRHGLLEKSLKNTRMNDFEKDGKPPSPKIWCMQGTFAGTLVNVRGCSGKFVICFASQLGR